MLIWVLWGVCWYGQTISHPDVISRSFLSTWVLMARNLDMFIRFDVVLLLKPKCGDVWGGIVCKYEMNFYFEALVESVPEV